MKPGEVKVSKIGIKIFNVILSAGLLLCITGCQSEKQDTPVVESTSQIEETTESELVEAEPVEFESETELSETETEEASTAESAAEETEDIIKNDFFSVRLDSMTEEEDNVTITFIFTNVSDISYYKGDEEFHPGDSWEKVIRFTRDKWESYDDVYIHYKLCDASIYDPEANVLFAGGAKYEMDEDLNISNLEIFEDVPVQMQE